MFNAISSFLAALSRLTGALNGLADTVETANQGVRQHLGLGVPALEQVPTPPIGNGEESNGVETVSPSKRRGK